MTLSLPPQTPSTACRNGNRDRISHRDAITATLPVIGSSPHVAVDNGVALFSSHYDVAQGDVLALLPPTPSRDDQTAPASAADATKRLRSHTAATAATTAPTPSGRPRKKSVWRSG